MMTPLQHNKYLGVAHLAYAAFYCVFVVLMMVFMGAMFIAMPTRNESWAMILVMGFFGVIYSLLIIPSIIAGYALLKRRRWAKVASIVAGVMAAMFFPVGTAVCVYTFWFLFSEPGKLLYDKPASALAPGSTGWVNRVEQGAREGQNISPFNPPDWR